MKTARLYISEHNNYLNYLENLRDYVTSDECNDLQDKCEKEIANMKNEKINNTNISFYDILTKETNALARCMKNENIVQVLKADDFYCKSTFPLYANIIKNRLRIGMIRKELLEQGNKICYFLFNNFTNLPQECIEKILSYLSNEDLKNLKIIEKA